ncbi:MAG: ABC transporter ATP-binding protein [Geodermatophilaceae bacterium]
MAVEPPPVLTTAAALQVRDLRAGYGRIIGIDGISLTVARGELVALLGANGAGKSTFLRAVSGMIRPWSGQVLVNGRDVTGRRSDQLVRAGLAHVPEGRRILPNLSVEENLRLGAFARRRSGDPHADLDDGLTRFAPLLERRNQKAGTLSGGEQQMLAIGRALMARPSILLLDEPSLGLSPRLVGEVFAMIADLASEGLTILLVEQNVKQGLGCADRGYLLSTGSIVMSGLADELLNDPAVIDSYLGGRSQDR